jgi:TldD protein
MNDSDRDPKTHASETTQNTHADLDFFRDRFGLDDRSLATALDTALERQVDYADLYFEYTTTDSVSLEEGIVKSGDRHLEQGVGVRAIRGERQGYAHSDEISVESARIAAGTARAIADETRDHAPVNIAARGRARDLYPVATSPTDVPVSIKVDWLNEIDVYARSKDPRITQVMASIVSQHKQVLIATSDGARVADTRPLVRVNVQVLAADGKRREVGYQGAGGRFELSQMQDPARWRALVDEAVRTALLNLEAEACPAGAMDVVLGPGWPGILLHEAIGHGLEGDFNRKQTSAFSDRMGQRVAAEGVTVVDDGTLPGRRGSINVDDEGTPSARNVLIENGVLVGYMQDRLNAGLMGVAPTGNGRRESYAHLPLPRMTNTFMLAGEDDPEEILRSVDRGLYAVSFGGGQVDITSGKFVFSASEAYRIENGRIGAPVKGATLIGNGPDVLTRVARIGHDLALDEGVGTCGKDGQGVPVGVGLPTIRVNELTVGGTEG